MVAVDVANTSAARAFDLSVDAVTGRATHQIVGGPRGLDETVYTRLRVEGGIQQAAPVVGDYFVSPQLGNRPIQLLGIDPFADWQFRDYGLSAPGAGLAANAGGLVTSTQPGLTAPNVPAGGTWSSFLTWPGALLLSDGLAARYGPRVGETLAVQIGGQRGTAFVVGLLHPSDPLDRQALDGVALADIATAQELTGRAGRLDRIDLILPAGDTAALQAVQRLLPPDAELVPASARHGHGGTDDGSLPPEPDRPEPAGARGGHVPDLQQYDLFGRAAASALRHATLPGRHPARHRPALRARPSSPAC